MATHCARARGYQVIPSALGPAPIVARSLKLNRVMAPAADTAGARPRLVVVYGHRSLDAMQIRASARGWCDLVWLVDSGDPSAAAVLPLLRRFGVVVDALGASPAQAAQALRAHSPDGLATFYDTGMEHVAAIAAELGLRFHSPEVARGLEDKLHQRAALRAGNLPTPGTAALPADADARDGAVARFGDQLSRGAQAAPGIGQLAHVPRRRPGRAGRALGGVGAEGPEDMLLEEYLPDGPAMPHGFEADYVSVETVMFAGRMIHLAVTGRFPLAPPFRETGYFIPSTLGPDQQRARSSISPGRRLRPWGCATAPPTPRSSSPARDCG